MVTDYYTGEPLFDTHKGVRGEWYYYDSLDECHQTRANWLAEVNEDIDVELDRERLLSYIQD